MKQYQRETEQLLRRLGVNSSYVGFRYTVYGIIANINNPDLIVYICKGLYLKIAMHYNVNITNVERNIRTIIKIIWEHGDREMLNHVIGFKLQEKPKNTIFIDALSQYVINSCQDRF